MVGRPEIAIDHRQPHPGCYVSKVGMVEELVLEGFQTLGGGVQLKGGGKGLVWLLVEIADDQLGLVCRDARKEALDLPKLGVANARADARDLPGLHVRVDEVEDLNTLNEGDVDGPLPREAVHLAALSELDRMHAAIPNDGRAPEDQEPGRDDHVAFVDDRACLPLAGQIGQVPKDPPADPRPEYLREGDDINALLLDDFSNERANVVHVLGRGHIRDAVGVVGEDSHFTECDFFSFVLNKKKRSMADDESVLDALTSAAETSKFIPVVKGGDDYCCDKDGTCHEIVSGYYYNEQGCLKGEEGYKDAAVDNNGNIVFDGFIDPSMHLILQKVFYYVRPGYTLPAYPTDRVSKQKYKREYGEYKRLSSASSPSPPWISKHAIDNIAASENEDNSKYKGAHPNGMCTPSYPNKRCEKEYTYLMDAFNIVGRYTPEPEEDEDEEENEISEGSDRGSGESDGEGGPSDSEVYSSSEDESSDDSYGTTPPPATTPQTSRMTAV